MNMSIFGRVADVVAAMFCNLTHPWRAGGVLSVVVLLGVLPVVTGSSPLAPPVITGVPVVVISVCSVVSSAF